MRRTQQRWVSFVLDAPSKKLKSTSRQVEHWRTRKMQASRATTNPYHKEQYISAFLEAQSADMVHRHSVEAESTAQAALPTTSTTSTHHNLNALAALAQELETRYATGASSAVTTTGTAALTHTHDSGSKAVRSSPVEFGAWRSAEGGDVRLQRRVRATDVVRHCVIREARTPPELSPEVLQRSRPPQPQLFSVQRLLAYLQSRSFRAATKPVQHDRLQGDGAEALQAMRYAPALQRSLALYCVFALSCHRDWQTSSHFVLWLQGQWTALADVTAAQRSTDAAHFAAVLFDTVRWASPKKSAALLPTLEELDHFCSAYHKMLRGGEDDNAVAGTGEKTGALWDPVVCAPLLSVAGLREEREAPAASQIDRVEQLVERYCVHLALPASYYHPRKQPKPLAYMPAVAWGEYLRTLHRCGADLSTLQAATDRLTDPSRTRQARQLLSSTHVWNAYLACSPGAHAAEVFRKNLKHFRAKATPATTAAVMTALLNEETETATAQARVLWDRLCATPPSAQMVLRTSSTVVAHARLLAAESNAAALAALLLSYHELYECFGVPREWFEEQQQQRRESLQEPLRVADGVRLLHRACAAHPLLIPPVVQAALVAAARKTEERVAAAAARALPQEQETVEGGVVVSSGKAEAMPELTAEDLAAML